MQRILELLGEQEGDSLWPKAAIQYETIEAYGVVKPGDHLLVLVGNLQTGYVHHGIATGERTVVHFHSPSGNKKMADAVIKEVTLNKFLAGHAGFGVLPYENDSQVARDRAVTIANLFARTPKEDIKEYNLLHWNCECFAWLCKTGGVKCTSDQVEKILNAIRKDLLKGENSVLLQSVAYATNASSSSCVVS